LFAMSNSVRLDTFAFAFVAAGLFAVMSALDRPGDRWRHVVAGLVFGLGLQAHIDVTVTAVACGVLYLVRWIEQSRQAGRWSFPSTPALYLTGWCAGLAVFVIFNILPDPGAFYRTTVQVRVDATTWYSGGTTSLAGSFLNPRVLIAKESARYAMLYRAMPWFETGAILAAIAAMAVRRSVADRRMLVVIIGVIVGSAVILNNDSPLYFIHVFPALAVPVAALFTEGFRRESAERGFSSASMALFAAFVSALIAVNYARQAVVVARQPINEAATALANRVRAVADARCTVAGDGALYVEHFADYPFFVSSRSTEVTYAMMFYGLRDEAEYWRRKQPGVVFTADQLSTGLGTYVAGRKLTQIDAGIWMDVDKCRK